MQQVKTAFRFVFATGLLPVLALMLTFTLTTAPLGAGMINVSPTATLSIGGLDYDLTPFLDDGIAADGHPTWSFENINLGGDGWSLVDADLYLKSDPVLFSSGTLINTTGGSLPFNFNFTLPVIPNGWYGNPVATLGVTVSSGVSGSHSATVTMTNTFNSGAINAGVDIGPVTCTQVGFGTNTCSYLATSGTSEMNMTSMETNLSGSLDPNSSLGLSGTFVTDPVPEPSTYVLLGSALLGLAIYGRRGRKKA